MAVPKGRAGVRPTAALVREAVFSMMTLNSDMVFIDMFAGSGIMGFTALSIGCGSAIFIDNHSQVVQGLRKSAKELGVSDRVRLWKGNVLACFNRLKDVATPCAVYADPPYAYSQWRPMLHKLASWLDDAACRHVFLESNKDLQPYWPQSHCSLAPRSRRYGEKQLFILTQQEGYP